MLKFNKVQLKQICRIMQKVIRNLSQKSAEEQSSHDSFSVNSQNIENDENVRTLSFKTEEVDFFDSHLAVSYDADNFIIIEKDVYFQDVYFFLK